MKITISRKTLLVLIILLLAGLICLALLPGRALSYLSSTRESAVSVQAAPASSMWALHGAFDRERWIETGQTGIYIRNMTDQDLWAFFAFTGNLRQVMKHCDPLLLPAGSEVEITLEPIDNSSSPRFLNPLAILTVDEGGKEDWKTFAGTVCVYTLNKYASLETEPIQLSGEDIWEIFVRENFGKAKEAAAETGEGDITAEEAADEAGSRPRVAVGERVALIVDRIAPGLLRENQFLWRAVDGLTLRVERLNCRVEELTAERERLLARIDVLEATIAELKAQLSRKDPAVPQEQAGESTAAPPAAEGAPAAPAPGDAPPLPAPGGEPAPGIQLDNTEQNTPPAEDGSVADEPDAPEGQDTAAPSPGTVEAESQPGP